MQQKFAVAKSQDDEKYGLLSQGASYLQNLTADSNEVGKLKTGSAVWGHSPIQRENTNSKKVTIEKLSKSGLGRCTKFDEASSNDEQKIILENR